MVDRSLNTTLFLPYSTWFAHAAGAGAFISGNMQNGVLLDADTNLVEGNFIGTDVTGTKAIPNLFEGVPLGKTSVAGPITQNVRLVYGLRTPSMKTTSARPRIRPSSSKREMLPQPLGPFSSVGVSRSVMTTCVRCPPRALSAGSYFRLARRMVSHLRALAAIVLAWSRPLMIRRALT